jgi:soluble lytic murein transglycosylase
MSSKVSWRLGAAALLMLASPSLAAVTEAQKALYSTRLAANASGQFGGMSAAPLTGVAPVPVLDALVTWDRLRREAYRGSFSEYAAFLKAYPDWPQSLVIRRQAEKALDDMAMAPDIVTFFKQFPPLSAAAKLRYAEALQATGKPGDAREMARDAWDSAGLDATQEARLLAQFGSDLKPEDEIGRAERLLNSGQTTAASRMLPRLDTDHRMLVLARIALKANSPDVLNRLAGVPDRLRNDPGLILDRANWMKRKGDVSGAEALLGSATVPPGSVNDPEYWLKQRLDFARVAWRAGRYEAAWRIAGRHNAFGSGQKVIDRSLSERQVYIDSEWLAGWLALRKLNRAGDAVGHFRNVRSAAQTPLSQSRGDYWTGRAAEAAGKSGEAKSAYEAASAHVDYFYGQLANERLGKPLALKRKSPPDVARKANDFRADSRVRAIFALQDIGEWDRQTIFLKYLADSADNLDEQALVADLAKPLGRMDAGVYAGKAARAEGELALLDAAFPMLNLPANLNSAFTMIHAITRQESQFDERVVSHANARGLMQLLPSTAAEQAAKMGMTASTPRLVSDPVYNVTLGSGYFSRLRENFGGSHVLAVAGYNAGPGNVRKFLAANGDPRAGVDVIDWIEAIPLSETKNYVQRVLENAVMYDLLHPDTAVMPKTNRLSAYLGKSTPG